MYDNVCVYIGCSFCSATTLRKNIFLHRTMSCQEKGDYFRFRANENNTLLIR